MSLNLADVLSPTPQMPKAAGGVVAAPEAGEGGAFAEALKAFRSAAETGSGEAGIAIPVPGEVGAVAPELPVRAQSETVIGLEAALVPAAPADAANTDPAVETPVTGVPLPETGKVSAAPDVAGDALPETAGEVPETADDAIDPNSVVAAAVVPVVTPAAPAVIEATAEEAALKIAGAAETPDTTSPQPQLPLAPATSDSEGAAPDSAPLLEGRASAAGAPPPVISTGETVPTLPKEVVENFAPRAEAADTADAAAAATKPATPPASATQSAPIPAPLQAVVAEPDVVSVQAKVVADTDANEDGEATPAVTTPAPRGGERAAMPAAASVPTSQAEPEGQPVLTEPVLAADSDTKAKAADGALAVLTEKPKTPAAAAKLAPAAEPETAAKPASAAAPAPAADPALDVKAPDPKEALNEKAATEKPAAERPAPATIDRSAPQTDARAPQAPLPVNDKPAPVDLAAKAVQQQSQTLPAAAIPQIAGEIASKAKRGATRFEIRLDPPELGRIDVRIDVDKDGRVMSRLMVEKTETLDLLKADQRALERALQDAGFKADQGSLSFSLKDHRDGQAKFDDQRQLHQPSETAVTEEEPVRHVAETAYRSAMRGPGGFDLRV
jgi:flagellar hook-length control protein FliK